MGPERRVSRGWAGTGFSYILQREKGPVLRWNSRNPGGRNWSCNRLKKTSVCLIHSLWTESLFLSNPPQGDIHSLLPGQSYLRDIFVSTGSMTLMTNWPVGFVPQCHLSRAGVLQSFVQKPRGPNSQFRGFYFNNPEQSFLTCHFASKHMEKTRNTERLQTDLPSHANPGCSESCVQNSLETTCKCKSESSVRSHHIRDAHSRFWKWEQGDRSCICHPWATVLLNRHKKQSQMCNTSTVTYELVTPAPR